MDEIPVVYPKVFLDTDCKEKPDEPGVFVFRVTYELLGHQVDQVLGCLGDAHDIVNAKLLGKVKAELKEEDA